MTLNQPHKNQSIVLFDGYCNLCSGSVRFISKRDKRNVFTFVPLQSEEAEKFPGLPRFETDSSASVILIEDENIYVKSTAALKIARQLRFPWNLFYVLIIVPASIRDGVYMFIARNRYKWFGKRETCYIK
jgi:predicted DCC family thiol-disulfide oxidoreductase YuxK